jgi:acetate kinase
MAAVRDGKSINTSMGFTPTGGLVISTRSGDLDPGLAPYLGRTLAAQPKFIRRTAPTRTGTSGMSRRKNGILYGNYEPIGSQDDRAQVDACVFSVWFIPITSRTVS